MATHPVMWTSPQPLWGRFESSLPNAFRVADQARPALLRFASDEFMEQVMAMLELDPRRLGETIARPETWRSPGGETPDLVSAPKPPRIARALARLRAGTAAPDPLPATLNVRTTTVNGVQRDLPLKLYHPAHQRHYLVAANLVCALPGFPDRTMATGGRERVGFLLRRLMSESTSGTPLEHEYAFIRDGRGPRWERVPRDTGAGDHYARSVEGEEMLPLFPLNFHDAVARPRRVFAGTIPVGRREEYMGVPRRETPLVPSPFVAIGSSTDETNEAKTRKSARKEQLKFDVTEPWKALIRAMYKAAEKIEGAGFADIGPTVSRAKKQGSTRDANEGAQLQSWLILLDFADYLANHLPDVWHVVTGATSVATLDPAEQALYGWLGGAATTTNEQWLLKPTTTSAGKFTTMRDALKRIVDFRDALENAERTYVSDNPASGTWPDFHLLLAGVREVPYLANDGVTTKYRYSAAGLQDTLVAAPTSPAEADDIDATPDGALTLPAAEAAAALVDKLVQLVIAAVDPDATTPAPPVPFAAQLRDAIKLANTNGDPGWFVIRCAYARFDCGPLEPSVISAPTQRFQLASFFDPDAPARPIRIALPIDTTAAGLRKHQKNTAFVISDILCGQMNRLKGLGFVDLVLSVLPWPFHKDLDVGKDGMGPCTDGSNNLGMICSLSIPIITICALILLFMIMLVLDLIFKWLPWFIICFPLPRFKAKSA